MSKLPKSSVLHGVILPFWPNADDPSECERYIKRVFEAVVRHYGEDEARRIFDPYGKPRTKRDKLLEENARLLLQYYLEGFDETAQWRKPNVHQLAVRLAKEKNTDADALERKIWRAIKDEKINRFFDGTWKAVDGTDSDVLT